MGISRRAFLRQGSTAWVLAAAAGSGLLQPAQARAVEWKRSAFAAKDVAVAQAEVGIRSPTHSAGVLISAPDIAENGAVVPVEVTSRIADTSSIYVIGEKNLHPLIAQIEIAPGTEPFISLRIKMGETSKLRAVVKAGGKFYTAEKEVMITIGGCSV